MLTYRAATERGPLVISVAEGLGDTGPAARFGFMSGLLWDFLQLDLTLVLVWVGIRLGMRPIRRLRDELAERSPADLRPIAEVSVPSELAPLTAALNRLFALLRGSIQSQQQFVANTAHQLRTPIAGMLAQLDLLVEEPAAQPVRERLTTLQHGICPTRRTSSCRSRARTPPCTSRCGASPWISRRLRATSSRAISIAR